MTILFKFTQLILRSVNAALFHIESVRESGPASGHRFHCMETMTFQDIIKLKKHQQVILRWEMRSKSIIKGNTLYYLVGKHVDFSNIL